MKKIPTEILQGYLAEARFEEVLELLLSETKNSPFYKQSVRLSSSYNDLKKEWFRGVISSDSYALMSNQLTAKIHDHIIDIERKQSKLIYQSKYRKSFAITTICILLIFTSLYVFVSVFNKGSFIFDKRSRAIYKIQRKANLEYMADNLRLDLKDSLSWCYGEKPKNCKNFGRLYTLEGARKACTELGYGWRLPTKEEWNDIIGPLPVKVAVKGMLGGERSANVEFLYLDENGMYWTNSKSSGKYFWIIYVYGSQGIVDWFDSGDTRHGFSCRCVRSLQ